MNCSHCKKQITDINKGVLKKTEIRDILGNKTSLKRLKIEHREAILKDTIPQRGLLGRKILTKSQLEKGIKDGILKEISFNGQIYFNEGELRVYVQKIMGLQRGDAQKESQDAKEAEQIKKIQSAKTGEPITLSGYGIIRPDGTDDGRRWIRREDAEKESIRVNMEKQWSEKSSAGELDIFTAATDEARKQFKLDINSLHGIRHWERVLKIGVYLSSRTGADLRVVMLFAALHDSCRENEGADMLHGHRVVEYLLGLNNKGLLSIYNKQLDQLTYACEHHSKRNAKSDDITIQTCWDADRLDLYRVGEIPDPAFLYTEAGKSPEAIDFALQLYLKSRQRGSKA